jgi:putative oxidoreductase
MTTTTTIAPRSRSPIVSFYTLFIRLASTLQSPLLLLIRLYIGYQCIISGWAHLHHVSQMTAFFTQLHIPAPKLNVYVCGSTELVGGALLLVGLCSRPVALILAFNFVVAMLTVELSNFDSSFSELGHKIWQDQSPILGDTAFPFLVTSILVLIFGPGHFSLDGLIKFIRSK